MKQNYVYDVKQIFHLQFTSSKHSHQVQGRYLSDLCGCGMHIILLNLAMIHKMSWLRAGLVISTSASAFGMEMWPPFGMQMQMQARPRLVLHPLLKLYLKI